MSDTLPELEVRLGNNVNFKEMRENCVKFHAYSSGKRDEHARDRAKSGKEAFHLYGMAKEKFHEAYRWFSRHEDEEEITSQENLAPIFRWFVDGLWDMHNAEIELGNDDPVMWARLWALEEACSDAFEGHWKMRYK